MPLRFDVLRAVAEITLDVDALDELDDHLSQFELAIQRRNAVAHDRWGHDPATGATFRSKYSARGTVKGNLIPTTVEEVFADAKFIYEVGMALFQFLGAHNLVPPLVERPSRHHKSKAERKKRRNSKL